MMILKQSTAFNFPVFMTDSTDHISGKTGATLTITASKDGAAFASITPTVTELANGWYSLALTTTHTNTLGALLLHVTASGADPTDLSAQVMASLPLTATEVANAVWDEVLTGATHNIATSAGKRLRQLSAIATVDSTVNDASATTTSFVTALTEATNDFYKDQLMIFTSGALSGQSRPVLSYNGTTKAVTFDEAWTSAPANTDAFTLRASHTHSRTQISTAVWDANPIRMQKNTALNNFEFIMTDSTNHDPATGLTVTVQRSIDGGAFAATTNSASEVASGVYKINLSAADLNGDVITLKFSAASADTRFVTIVTQL